MDKALVIQILSTIFATINSMRFNTDVYQNRKWCEGCTLCDIKIIGDFARAMTNLQEIIVEIDREVSYAFSLEIEKIEAQINTIISDIGDKNLQARTKINEVISKNKPQLDIAIFEYFTLYKEYSKQFSTYILKNGTFNGMCKKYTAFSWNCSSAYNSVATTSFLPTLSVETPVAIRLTVSSADWLMIIAFHQFYKTVGSATAALVFIYGGFQFRYFRFQIVLLLSVGL